MQIVKEEVSSFGSPSLAAAAHLLYRTLADSLNVGGLLLANDKGGTGWWKECGEQVLKRLWLDICIAS